MKLTKSDIKQKRAELVEVLLKIEKLKADQTSLEKTLLSVGRSRALSGLDPGCSFLENREACEQRLRLSLDLLA